MINPTKIKKSDRTPIPRLYDKYNPNDDDESDDDRIGKINDFFEKFEKLKKEEKERIKEKEQQNDKKIIKEKEQKNDEKRGETDRKYLEEKQRNYKISTEELKKLWKEYIVALNDIAFFLNKPSKTVEENPNGGYNWIIPDGQLNDLIKTMKDNNIIVTSENIAIHNAERSEALYGKNNTPIPKTVSTMWKKFKGAGDIKEEPKNLQEAWNNYKNKLLEICNFLNNQKNKPKITFTYCDFLPLDEECKNDWIIPDTQFSKLIKAIQKNCSSDDCYLNTNTINEYTSARGEFKNKISSKWKPWGGKKTRKYKKGKKGKTRNYKKGKTKKCKSKKRNYK